MFSPSRRNDRKPSPNHELIHHGYIRGARPEDPPRRGFSTFVNALAFSTLLSSQETDAHRVPNFRSSLGATLLIYPVFPSCQIGAGSQLIEPVRPIGFL